MKLHSWIRCAPFTTFTWLQNPWWIKQRLGPRSPKFCRSFFHAWKVRRKFMPIIYRYFQKLRTFQKQPFKNWTFIVFFQVGSTSVKGNIYREPFSQNGRSLSSVSRFLMPDRMPKSIKISESLMKKLTSLHFHGPLGRREGLKVQIVELHRKGWNTVFA